MDDNNSNWDAKQMFDYLREDQKEAREENRTLARETNTKIDNLTEMLTKHVSDDTRNFQNLELKINSIEVGGKTTEKVEERNYSHNIAWVGVVIALIAAMRAYTPIIDHIKTALQ
jgi:hypothetical protein